MTYAYVWSVGFILLLCWIGLLSIRWLYQANKSIKANLDIVETTIDSLFNTNAKLTKENEKLRVRLLQACGKYEQAALFGANLCEDSFREMRTLLEEMKKHKNCPHHYAALQIKLEKVARKNLADYDVVQAQMEDSLMEDYV